jgi:hypothetical protein
MAGKTQQALDVLHECGILVCMLLFVVSGALLMLRYANDGDALPILGGFVSMGIGAALLLRTPGRVRQLVQAEEAYDENEAYDEAVVRVQHR